MKNVRQPESQADVYLKLPVVLAPSLLRILAQYGADPYAPDYGDTRGARQLTIRSNALFLARPTKLGFASIPEDWVVAAQGGFGPWPIPHRAAQAPPFFSFEQWALYVARCTPGQAYAMDPARGLRNCLRRAMTVTMAVSVPWATQCSVMHAYPSLRYGALPGYVPTSNTGEGHRLRPAWFPPEPGTRGYWSDIQAERRMWPPPLGTQVAPIHRWPVLGVPPPAATWTALVYMGGPPNRDHDVLYPQWLAELLLRALRQAIPGSPSLIPAVARQDWLWMYPGADLPGRQARRPDGRL